MTWTASWQLGVNAPNNPFGAGKWPLWKTKQVWTEESKGMAFFLLEPNCVISCFPNFPNISEGRGKKKKGKNGKEGGQNNPWKSLLISKTKDRVEVPQAQLKPFPSLYPMQTWRPGAEQIIMPNHRSSTQVTRRHMCKFTLWRSFSVSWQCLQVFHVKDKI